MLGGSEEEGIRKRPGEIKAFGPRRAIKRRFVPMQE